MALQPKPHESPNGTLSGRRAGGASTPENRWLPQSAVGGRGNQGKSGGVRTIFYYFVRGETIYLEFVYAKNEKENLT